MNLGLALARFAALGGGGKLPETPPVFNVMDYGAIADGTTNDSAACQSALDAVTAIGGGVLYFPSGAYYFPYDQEVHLTPNVSVVGSAATIKGHGFALASNTTIANLAFTNQAGLNGWIWSDNGDGISNVGINNCTFTGRGAGHSDQGITLWPTTNGLGCVENLRISNCQFSNFETACLQFSRLNNSVIENNLFTCMSGGRGVYFRGGHGNVIQNNTIGGTSRTPIIFMLDITEQNGHGALGLTNDNHILHNDITGGTEECITFDSSQSFAFENDTIHSVAGGSIVLHHAGWAASGADYSGYDLIFLSGASIGRTATVLTQSGATVTIDATGLTIAPDDEVVIAATTKGNLIHGNTVVGSGGVLANPVMLYGQCFENVVSDNILSGSQNSDISAPSLDLNTVYASSVTGAKQRCPNGYNTISGNTCAENILLDYSVTASPAPTPFYSHGSAVTGNTCSDGGLVAAYQRLYKSGNTFSAADSFNHVTEL